MEYKTIGESGLQLSVITFGAWAAGGWMWGKTDRNDAIEAIRASYDEGVTSIDTAPIYGQGDSESIVGEAIKNMPRDNRACSSTQCGKYDDQPRHQPMFLHW